MEKLQIALIGFGNVGKGLSQIIQDYGDSDVQIKYVCVKNTAKVRNSTLKFIYDINKVLQDKSINVIVEVTDDVLLSYQLAKHALKNNLVYITANKQMLAQHLEEICLLQMDSDGVILYEASCCASIPIIKTLEEYYTAEPIVSLSGIFNGTTNYILSQMTEHNISYHAALKQAQENGFAESDPSIDVLGKDTLFKLSILCLHAFGKIVDPKKVFCYGISTIEQCDIEFAKKLNRRIKLTANAFVQDNKLVPIVIPRMVKENDGMAKVNNEFNAVVVKGKYVGTQVFFGKGAGGFPTGAAMFSDILSAQRGYIYGNYKYIENEGPTRSDDAILEIYVRATNSDVINTLPFKHIHLTEYDEKLGYAFRVGDISLEALKTYNHLDYPKMFVAMLEHK